jgi:hypothetical protein
MVGKVVAQLAHLLVGHHQNLSPIDVTASIKVSDTIPITINL